MVLVLNVGSEQDPFGFALSMGFSRQEYWSGLPCPSSGNLPDPGIEPTTLMSFTLAGRFLPLVPHGKLQQIFNYFN